MFTNVPQRTPAGYQQMDSCQWLPHNTSLFAIPSTQPETPARSLDYGSLPGSGPSSNFGAGIHSFQYSFVNILINTLGMIEMDDFIEDVEVWHAEPSGAGITDGEATDDPFTMSLPPGNSSVCIQFLYQH